MDEHPIEPELLNAPPRRVKRRGTHGYGTVFSRLLLLPLLVFCLGLPLWAIHMTVVRLAGPIVPCRIVAKYRTYDTSDSKWLHYLKYHAIVGGKAIEERELVDLPQWSPVTVGQSERLQVSPWFPGYDSLLLLPGHGVWGDVWVAGVGSLVAGALMALLLWYLVREPARRRNLVTRGTPTVGRLKDKTRSAAKSYGTPYFYLHYEYWPDSAVNDASSPSPTERRIGKQSVRNADFDEAQLDGLYTVLYDPKVHQSSVLYRFGDFVAKD